MSLTLDDWIRGFVCLLYIEGILYLFFPKVIQAFSTELITDAPLRNLRNWGAFLLFAGTAILIWRM
ncbi:MAG: DUF2065 family protein [Alphaproteobacteria bacterium]|nr:DUF2065 family protein [Alphaproteobacteria bacterium]